MSHPALFASLEVLILTALEHAGCRARAAFYVADHAGRELRHVIGMPEAYAKCVDGFVIGEQSLACGLAAARREPIISPDVNDDPRWAPWRWLAERFSYRACWSFPVVAPSSEVLGTFAMYYAEPREATARDVEIASLLSRTAAAVISRC